MTTPGSAPGDSTTAPDLGSRRRALALAGILLLAAVCAIPLVGALVSPEFHRETRQVVTTALDVSALPTLVLSVAASVRRGTGLLLAASGVAVFHLIGAVVLLGALGPGDGGATLRVTVQLIGAVIGLGVAWWRTRDRRVGLVVAPAIVVAGHLIAAVAPFSAVSSTWWMYLAPHNTWGALPVVGVLVVATLVGLVGRDAPDGGSTARVATPVAAATDPDRLAGAGLLLLAAAAALDIPTLFAHGPGIRPGGAGTTLLVAQLVAAAVPAVLVLAAGAAASGRRWLTWLASITAAALAAAFVVPVAGGVPAGSGPWVPLLGLAVTLVLAWAAVGRSEPVRSRLLWASALLAVVAAAPWSALTDPSARVYQGDPAYWRMFVQPQLPVLVMVAAAALLGRRHRWTRVAAAVLLAGLVVDDLAALVDQAATLRRLTALDGLRVVGHLAVCLLAVAAAAAVRHPVTRPGPPATTAPAAEG